MPVGRFENKRHISTRVLEGVSHDNTRLPFIPYGDYVKDPDGWTMFNFMVLDAEGEHQVLLGGTLAEGLDSQLAAVVKASDENYKIGEYTLYYPLSLI